MNNTEHELIQYFIYNFFFLNMTITRGGYITLDFGLILVPFNIAIIAFPADVTSYYDWDERDIL